MSRYVTSNTDRNQINLINEVVKLYAENITKLWLVRMSI